MLWSGSSGTLERQAEKGEGGQPGQEQARQQHSGRQQAGTVLGGCDRVFT